MNQYEKNVTKVMKFLTEEKYSASVISAHRICYRELKEFLVGNKLSYAFDNAMNWINFNKQLWTYREYTSRRHCIHQLEDVYRDGDISLNHVGPRGSAYSTLCLDLRKELDEYLDSGLINSTDSQYRISCSRFLAYLQKHDVKTIKQLNYKMLFRYHKEDYHRSSRSKDVYEDIIRGFLRYHALRGHCSDGYALALNKLMLHQIIKIENSLLAPFSLEQTHSITWSTIESFLSEMKEIDYGNSVMKCSKHTLTLLYIFLDMHHLRLCNGVLWLWFENVKLLLGTNWKQARRTLNQFWIYINTGKVTTATTGDPFYIDSIEYLPDWSKVVLIKYLDLLKREGYRKSTIAMQKSSNLRFCQYLQNIELRSFEDISSDTLQSFNKQDFHATAEAKVAYNSRIRGFLMYLYEQGCITNPFLYKALPSASAPSTRIVNVLSDEEIKQIWEVNTDILSPKAFRDYAILCMGLTMGFRASDIVSIKFSDINWNTRSINLAQVKTGKRIHMPMPTKTGNILFSYLSRYRPKSTSPYVFIRHEAPHGKLTSGVCRLALNRILPNRNVPNKGFHVVRKTFATALLQGYTKVELISDTLGHSSDNTVYKYLALDKERMKECPLSLQEMDITLEGGVFNA